MLNQFNNRHRLMTIAGLMLGLVILSLAWEKVKLRQNSLASRLAQLPDHSLVEVRLNHRSYQLEVANTPQSITLGLGKRDRNQVRGDGMIFVLPKKQVARFWMKGMRFPLDFYWLDETGVLVGVEKNIPPPKPNQPTEKLPVISSGVPVRLVVELPTQ